MFYSKKKKYTNKNYFDSSDDEFEDDDEKKIKFIRKEVNVKLPRKIIVKENPDKISKEYYKPNQNPVRFPTPFRLILAGKSDAGKSLMIRNIFLARQAEPDNKFVELFVVHGSAYSKEYDDLEPTEFFTDIPSFDELLDPLEEGEDKDSHVDSNKLLIIDDYDFTKISGESLKKLSELFRFGSTHHNISIIISYQSFFRLPKILKDMCNIIILYKNNDLDENNNIGRRVGLKKEEIQYLFNTFLITNHDSLLINLIPNAPYKFGKNLYEPLDNILPFKIH